MTGWKSFTNLAPIAASFVMTSKMAQPKLHDTASESEPVEESEPEEEELPDFWLLGEPPCLMCLGLFDDEDQSDAQNEQMP